MSTSDRPSSASHQRREAYGPRQAAGAGGGSSRNSGQEMAEFLVATVDRHVSLGYLGKRERIPGHSLSRLQIHGTVNIASSCSPASHYRHDFARLCACAVSKQTMVV